MIYLGLLAVAVLAVGLALSFYLQYRTEQIAAHRLSDPDRVKALVNARDLIFPPDQQMTNLAKRTAEEADMPVAFCSFVFPDRQFILGQYGFREGHPSAAPEGVTLDDSICRLVVIDQKPVEIRDTSQLRYLRNCTAVKEGTSSYYGSPVLFDGQIIGAFGVTGDEPRTFSERQKRVVDKAAVTAGSMIQLRK